MRSAHVVIAVLIGWGSLGCTTTLEIYTPPPTPPNIRTFTLTSAVHELADAQNNFVPQSSLQLTQASQIWRQCAVAMVIAFTTIDLLNGQDPENGNLSIRLGEKFPATIEEEGVPHATNWAQVRNAAFRKNATKARGSDDHYTKLIRVFKDDIWNSFTLGVTPVTPGPDNVSVVRPLEDGKKVLILAHEIGHQLGLPDLEPSGEGNKGNLMCKAVDCSGFVLTGNMAAYPQPLQPYTQCFRVRDWGDYWDLYEEA